LVIRLELANELGHVSAPPIERVSALGEEIMPLVDGGNPGNRPRLVVEDFVGDMGRNAQASHAGDDGSPEIMQAPTADAAKLVQSLF
jgi:hypothetical protein